MFENEQSNSEINLNLKMPPEQPDGDFSMRTLVLTIYEARKVFLIWCFIGLFLGIVAAGGYYVMNTYVSPPATPSVQGDVAVTLKLNYSGAAGAAGALLPNGAEFDKRFFYEDLDIWENALAEIEHGGVTVGDLIGQVKIDNQKLEDEAVSNVFVLTMPIDYNIFSDVGQMKAFLLALCEEYKSYLTEKYYTDVSIGTLYGQQYKTWDEASAEILWDPLRFDINFAALSARYKELEKILTVLYESDPNYKTPEGKNFNDYAKELRDIYLGDVASWDDKLLSNIYIRNVDQFIAEAPFRIAAMERNRQYNLELAQSHSELLYSFQQTEAQGVVVGEAVSILMAAKEHAQAAADLQRQIDQMVFYYEVLQLGEQDVRSNSRAAEAALVGFISDLGRNQANLRSVIYDYYGQMQERAAETSIIYSNALVVEAEDQPAQAGGVSMTRMLMILIGLTFVGFVIGFCATFVKKYIDER